MAVDALQVNADH